MVVPLFISYEPAMPALREDETGVSRRRWQKERLSRVIREDLLSL